MNKKRWMSLALSAALTLSLSAPALAAENGHGPVDGANSTYIPTVEEAQTYVTEKGWMTGTDKGFEPEGTVTRATMYEMLWKMEGSPVVEAPTEHLSQLAEATNGILDAWWTNSARWAYREGLTTGVEGGRYEGERVITKAEVITILYRYMKDYKGQDVSLEGDWSLEVFEDAAKVQDWSKESMTWAWISGVACQEDTDPTIDPDVQVKRAELAQMLTVMGGLISPYVESAVTYENDGRTVPAVVTMPTGVKGKVPAVVMAHGHGGSKDENVGFPGIARALAKAGIATIRMDFPGCGESTEPFTENTLRNMKSDVTAGLAYLEANYDVDPDHVGILGYSMGGRIAMELATAEDNPYSAVYILSGVSTPGEVCIAGLLPEGMTQADAEKQAKETGSFDYTTQYGQNLSLSAEWFEDMMIDPLKDADKYTGPMIVVHGDQDVVVDDATNKLTVATFAGAREIIVPGADHGYGFYSDQPDVTAMVEGKAVEFFSENLKADYTGDICVGIKAPETDSIPAHTIPVTLRAPADTEGKKYPAVVMLHGTGSNRDEAGNGYKLAAPVMAAAGIVTLRLDFMGSGEATSNYSDYCYTSANIDAKAAADYLATLDYVDPDQIAVMGWSQGGTNALLAAAAYPETFSAVITWSGAPVLGGAGLFGDKTFDQAYATAKKNGSYEMTFDWRTPLQVGERWFKEVKETDVLKETAKITAPVLAINGDQDTTVAPENAAKIAEAAQNGRDLYIAGADHTYNVFTETESGYPALMETVNAGIGFLLETYQGHIDGTVNGVSKYGNIGTDIPAAVFAGAGYEVGDILTITVDGQSVDLPFGTGYSNVDTGSAIALTDTSTNTVAAAVNMGNFSKTYNAVLGTAIRFEMGEKEGYLEEYEIRNIDALRTNVREDYSSDEVFANFRPVVMGDIAEGRLYRGSSPVNPELGRNTYVDAFLKANGVKTVIDLADSEEEYADYEGVTDSYAYTTNTVKLNMGVDFAAEDFSTKLKTGLEYMIANEGPYFVHCNEGKDRCGFVTMVLEMLMGGEYEEIVDDYMLSYENYYGVEHGSDRWERIARSNVIANMLKLTGAEDETALAKADLVKAAETYLTETVGLTAEQVTELKTALSK